MPVIESWSRMDHNALRDLVTPALLVDPAAVRRNLESMVDLVGGPRRAHQLRPHIKTHKTSEIVSMQKTLGIVGCKAATVEEAETAALGGATDILVAHQLVGPKAESFLQRRRRFASVKFAVVVDSQEVATQIAERLLPDETPLDVFIDVDVGMGRTGISLGDQLTALRHFLMSDVRLNFRGLHVYDGHLHQSDVGERQTEVANVLARLQNAVPLAEIPTVVVSGSPTLPQWADLVADDARTVWQFSPGTTVFWDVGYAMAYEDLPFEIAACVLARVISKPGPGRICLDVGTKAIATEMPLDERLVLPAIPDASLVSQNEEHLLVSTDRASQFNLGDSLVVFPRHICPSVACYTKAHCIEEGRLTDRVWQITGRG